jgi:hypothetical protein
LAADAPPRGRLGDFARTEGVSNGWKAEKLDMGSGIYIAKPGGLARKDQFLENENNIRRSIAGWDYYDGIVRGDYSDNIITLLR